LIEEFVYLHLYPVVNRKVICTKDRPSREQTDQQFTLAGSRTRTIAFMAAEDQKSGDGVLPQPNQFQGFLGTFARSALVLLLSMPRFTVHEIVLRFVGWWSIIAQVRGGCQMFVSTLPRSAVVGCASLKRSIKHQEKSSFT
jgi:hypothetical protein